MKDFLMIKKYLNQPYFTFYLKCLVYLYHQQHK